MKRNTPENKQLRRNVAKAALGMKTFAHKIHGKEVYSLQRRGFTLIELMIVVAIIAIIAAIAIPNLIRSRMSANEANAAGSVRMISTGQVAFQTASFVDSDNDGVGDYGTLPQLADPDGSGSTPPFIDAVLGNGSKSGYGFVVTVQTGTSTTNPAYTCIGTPHAQNQTGVRQFYVDETGVIRYTTDGSTVNGTSPPLS